MSKDGWTRTACPYCGVGCGVLAKANADGTASIAGDPEHPANFGRLCSKGSALGETLSLDGRLLHPEIGGARATWDAALDEVAKRFAQTIAEHGPDSVAFYVSGQILTEDYYAANKLMKGFIGSSNIDTNSRLCMASSVAGHRRAFGNDTVPGTYADLEMADLVLLIGSNLAWCHPVLYQRLAAAREARGTQVVVIDPRETATCDIADLHLPLAPGSDVALMNGLLAHLAAAGRIDHAYVARHTSGFDEAVAAAAAMSLAEIAQTTGLPAARIADFYELFADTERVVTIYSQGVNQSTSGTDKVNAIINCHLATGRIGRPGMGPLSVTGQPNAMGGRETGGLANLLAAHMELDNPDHGRIVADFWSAPRLAQKPGLKAVDLFRAVGDGRVKALWIMATNPVVSMPEADRVRRALEACPFIVVSDVVRETDTTRHAHVLLPSTAWGEKDGTVTNSERRISRQRAFLAAPGEARPDWWQMAEVGRRMGHGAAFWWQTPADIFAEYAALTAIENDGKRDLDLGAYANISHADYDAMAPFQWPQPAGRGSQETRFFAEGGFFTPDRRGRMIATPFRAPQQPCSPQFPLILNTGRVRDQWHTMTRTAKAPRLMAHAPEPFVEVHPTDAAAFGLAAGAVVEIESPHGRALVRVVVSVQQSAGSVFVPMHWTSEFSSLGRIDAVVGSATDAISGQPEMKHTGVKVQPFAAEWYGFAVMREKPKRDLADYVAVTPIANGYRVEMAGRTAPADWDETVRGLLGIDAAAEMLAYRDAAAGQHRFAAFADGRLLGALFVARRPLGMARAWAGDQLGEIVAAEHRLRLLAGRPGSDARDKGDLVCACFEVGCNDIVEAIVGRGAQSVADVGHFVKAGTNCGSCRSDIRRILDETRLEKAS